MTVEQHVAYGRQATELSEVGVLSETNCKPLQLQGATIDVQTHWFHARVVVRHEFKNVGSEVCKAFAAFRLEDGWSVSQFRCEVGKNFATARLEDVANRATHPSYGSNGNFFSAAVPWPVNPQQSVLTTLVLHAPLQVVGTDSVQLRIPKSIIASPQHFGETDTESSSWKKAFTIPTAPLLPKSLVFSCKGTLFAAAREAPTTTNMKMAMASRGDQPQNFSIKWEEKKGSKGIHLADDIGFKVNLIPDEDTVSVKLMSEDAKHCAADDRYALAVSVVPKFTAEQLACPNSEVVFAIDCSNSNQRHIDCTKRAVALAIRGLPSSTLLNVVAFGSDHNWLHPDGSVTATQSHVDEAIAFVRGLDANMGETRIYSCIKQVYVRPAVAGYVRQFVLLTDGEEIKNNASILKVVNSNTHSTRVVSIGIGEHSDTSLLQKMAEVSNGVFAGAASSSDIASALVSCLSKVLVPTLTQVGVTYTYDGAEDIPPIRPCLSLFPVVPNGERCVFHAFASEQLRGCTIIVNAEVGPQQMEYRVHTGPPDQAEHNVSKEGDATTVSLAHAAAASARIRALVDHRETSVIPPVDATECTRLSTTFSVMSPFVSFAGHSADGSDIDSSGRMVQYSYTMETDTFDKGARAIVYRDASGKAVDPDSVDWTPKSSTTTSKFMNAVVSAIVDSFTRRITVDDVLMLQQVDGSWPVEKSTSQALDIPLPALLESAGKNGESPQQWITAVVCACLSVRFAKMPQSAESTLALSKARQFLSSDGKEALIVAASVYYTDACPPHN